MSSAVEVEPQAKGLITIDQVVDTPAEFTPQVRVVIDSILNNRLDTKNNFATVYWNSPKYIKKFLLARALIMDGRLPAEGQRQLYDDFLMPAGRVSQTPEYADDEHLKLQLKDRIHLLLVDKEIIKATTDEGASAEQIDDSEETLLRIVKTDEQLNRLTRVLPIEVMTDVITVRLFSDISDQEKRRHRQMFVSRSLIRQYLGDITVYKPRGDVEFQDLFADVPEQIFDDKHRAILNVVRDYYTGQALTLFGDDPDEVGFNKLGSLIDNESSDLKRKFLKEVDTYFRKEVSGLPVPNRFRATVESWEGKQSICPTMRQRYVVCEFLKNNRSYVMGGVGSGKTMMGFLGMEILGGERALIVGPAKARNTWAEQAAKHFKEGMIPTVFAVESRSDLDNPRIRDANYVYISAEFLSNASVEEKDDALKRKAKQELRDKIWEVVVERKNTDGVIVDEAHTFNNANAGCTKVLIDLVNDINKRYKPKLELDTTLPIMALSATPAGGSLEDLDVIFGLLYSDRFSILRRLQPGRTTFSQAALRDPKLAHAIIRNQRLMIQFTTKDIYGNKVPEIEPQIRQVEMSPAQNVIYEWVTGLSGMGVLEKTELLIEVLLNPELVKEKLRDKGWMPQNIRNTEELRETLIGYFEQWQKWIVDYRDPRIPYELFSADWIAKFGGKDFLLECFFNQELVSGVDSLVFQIDVSRTNLALVDSWIRPEAVSPKFLALKRLIQERIHQEGKGFLAEERIIVVSPLVRQGITRHLFDDVTDEALRNNTFSLYESIVYEWLDGLPTHMAVSIDGGRSFAYRDRIAAAWRGHGADGMLTVVTMDSVNESRDWAPRDTADNQNIKKAIMAFLGWGWAPSPMDQMIGRVVRPGLGKLVDVIIYEVAGTIEEGLRSLVKRKRLMNRLALYGLPISKEDQGFFDRATAAGRILVARPNVDQFFIKDALRRLRAMSEAEFDKELSRTKGGISNYERWARAYFQEGRDEFGIVGNNAELVSTILLKRSPRRILSVGAGSCLLNRKIISHGGMDILVDNIDPNEAVMKVAKEQFPQIGNIIRGWASHVEAEDSSYDVIDCSFVLDLLNCQLRAQSLAEMNRVLRLGGTCILTFPDGALDDDTFANWVRVLPEGFGLSVVNESSGFIWASDIKPKKPIGWVLTLQKVTSANPTRVRLEALGLLTDPAVVVSRYKQKPDTPPAVITVEYPIFSSKVFEVVNPLTGDRSQEDSGAVIADYTGGDGRVEDAVGVTNTPEKEDGLTLDGVKAYTNQLTAEQYSVFKRLGRYLERRLEEIGQHKSFTERNVMLTKFLMEGGLDDPTAWRSNHLERFIDRILNKTFSRD